MIVREREGLAVAGWMWFLIGVVAGVLYHPVMVWALSGFALK